MDAVKEGWARRVAAAQQARRDAEALEEQVIRDAVNADDGFTPSDAARALGTQNKARVWAVLSKGPDGRQPGRPAPVPVVYLRGRGRAPDTWRLVEEAMWARGWDTTHDRTSAWHLARGGLQVVFCDFSTDLDHPEPAPGGGLYVGYNLYVRVGMVRARWAEQEEPGYVGDLLPTRDHVRLMGQPWLDTPVTVKHQEMDLPLVNGGEHDEPTRWDPDVETRSGMVGCPVLDEQALARLVADAFKE